MRVVRFTSDVVLFSIVATHLRCGGFFSDSIITNFLLILRVNNFENRLSKAYKNGAIFGPTCTLLWR